MIRPAPLKVVVVVILLTTAFSNASSSANDLSNRQKDAAAAATGVGATATTSRHLVYDNKALLNERTHTEMAKYSLDYCLNKLVSIKPTVNVDLNLAYHVSYQSCGGGENGTYNIDRRNVTTVTILMEDELSSEEIKIGTVTFSCHDVLLQRECHILPNCQYNADCDDEYNGRRTWCRQTTKKNRFVVVNNQQKTTSGGECVPYQEIGDVCYGFGIENFNGLYCRPGLKCDGQDWNTFDAAGICLPLNSPCKKDEDCMTEGKDDEDNGFHHSIGSRWCRPTDATGSSSECVAYQLEGEECTGLVPTFAQQRCAPPNMACKSTDPASNADDAGGTCQSIQPLDAEQEEKNEDDDTNDSSQQYSCPDAGVSSNCITTQSQEDCIMLQSMGCQEIVAIQSTCPVQYECVDDNFDTNSIMTSNEDSKLPRFSIAAVIIGAMSFSTAIMLLLHFSNTSDKTDDEHSAGKKSSTDLSESNESSSGDDDENVDDDEEEEETASV